MVSTLRHALDWLVTDSAQQTLMVALVHDPDFSLLLALLKAARANSQRDTRLHRAVLQVFGPYEDQLLRLVSSLMLQQMTETFDWSTLFRSNSFTTALIREYTNDLGSDFLRSALQCVIQELSDSDASFEVNPVRLQPEDDLEKNQLRLRMLAERILDDVLDAAPRFPSSIAKVYNCLDTHINCVLDRNQNDLSSFSESEPGPVLDLLDPRDSDTTVMNLRRKTEFISQLGGFVFLRFICPALIMPQKAGLVASDARLAKNIQRSLVLVAKILQNLANNTESGWKETYMEPFDDFLAINRPRLINFYEQIGVFSGLERRRSNSRQINSLVPQVTQLWTSSELRFRQCDLSTGPTAKALETLRAFIVDHAESIESILAMDVSVDGPSCVIEAYQRASIHPQQLVKNSRAHCDEPLEISKQSRVNDAKEVKSRYLVLARQNPRMKIAEDVQDEITDMVSHQRLQLIRMYYSKMVCKIHCLSTIVLAGYISKPKLAPRSSEDSAHAQLPAKRSW